MGFWRAVDWQRPWLGGYRASGEAACRCLEDGMSVAEALNRLAEADPPAIAAGLLRFVPQAALPAGEPYEAFIARTACVPTRDNLHDLFNGLAWLRFPLLKRRLNEGQAEQIVLAGVSATRGAVRDMLTLFDENAALWQPPPVLLDALRRRDWTALFVTHRAHWRDAPLTLFGHALMEKLTQPRKPMTAHLWIVPQGADLEAHLAAALTPDLLATKPHLPLPVLGVPGWWPANESRDFYDDDGVFRRPLG